ncbi:hypothetical protein [Azospirillum himalayense]|uniref:Right-handed parallel beta-helix repeat-containing protein n=1 Tax=Azospirillum himalayense TaxID=654847 RepID=A0ABW0G8H6_9PROT
MGLTLLDPKMLAPIPAAGIVYTPVAPTAPERPLSAKLQETVSLQADFGASLDGTTDDLPAWNRFVAWANDRGGGVSVNVPAGRSKLSAPVDPIIAPDVYVMGAGASATKLLPAGGAALTWGSDAAAQVVGGGIEGLGFEYSAPPSTSLCLHLKNCTRLWFDDIEFTRARCIASIGTATKPAALVSFSNLRGSLANVDAPALDLINGAGLFVDDQTSLYVDGVGMPVHPAPMTTTPGRDFLRAVAGNWDTISIGGSLFERFDRGVVLAPVSGGAVVNNVWLDGTKFDYCRSYGLRSAPGAGCTVFGVHAVGGAWFMAWEGNAVSFDGTGTNWSHVINGARLFLSGDAALVIGTAARHIKVTGCDIYAANRKGLGASSVVLSGEDCTLVGNEIGYDTSAVGLPYQGTYGVAIAADLATYTVAGNSVRGSLGAFQIGDNAAPSIHRRVASNSGDNYVGPAAGGLFTTPDSGTAWINTTPHRVEVHVYGGTVTGWSKNGTNIAGKTSGTLTLDPGEQLVLTYSSAPSVTFFRLG